ncbi:M48 family metallopeptidase [candidate division WWE3 bacterium]|uniref:Protease HtpX homolog n=1 Tax=candidate division WWE3 bacterium TaxID=2053526 RepID=A0A955RRC0_UNCKA|nr:M48 family metallopeptidase [candidate division WWE3 bacterium]
MPLVYNVSVNLYDQISNNKRKSFLIMIFFVIVVAILGYIFSLAMDAGYSLFIVATVFALTSAGFSYFAGDKVALTLSGAKKVTKQDAPRLFRTVENLSIGAGLVPMPEVYLINDPAINAFATGRDPKHASVAVTTGALNKLTDLELEGVVAHELSHVKNFDIRTMAVAVVLVGVIALVSEWFLRANFFRGRRSNNSEGGSIVIIFAIVGAILAPLMAQLLKFALSRQREYLADASGALLTRYPEGLASALQKIELDHTPLKSANSATAHMYIANPLGDRRGEKIANLFSTHPPIEERIARLRGMKS